MPQKRQKYTTNKGNKYIHCKETLVDNADFQKSIQSTILPEQRTCTLFIQEITLTKNIKRFNHLNIRSFSRGEVYESWVPGLQGILERITFLITSYQRKFQIHSSFLTFHQRNTCYSGKIRQRQNNLPSLVTFIIQKMKLVILMSQ